MISFKRSVSWHKCKKTNIILSLPVYSAVTCCQLYVCHCYSLFVSHIIVELDFVKVLFNFLSIRCRTLDKWKVSRHWILQLDVGIYWPPHFLHQLEPWNTEQWAQSRTLYSCVAGWRKLEGDWMFSVFAVHMWSCSAFIGNYAERSNDKLVNNCLIFTFILNLYLPNKTCLKSE